MLRFSSLLGLSMLAIGGLPGCNKADGADDLPTPTICFPGTSPATCYSGTVVAYTCMAGVLVSVDPAYPIGAPATLMPGNRLVGSNVIAVANPADLPRNGQVGQKLYFTSVSASTLSPLMCQAADGPTTPVPILTLTGVATVGCDSVRTN